MVKLYLEERYSPQLLHEELGIGLSTISCWVKAYREQGEDGLKAKPWSSSKSRVPVKVKSTIIDVKKNNPTYGTRRITDILKRFFLIKTSPKTVGKTLADKGLDPLSDNSS
ncbi:MAG: helix-turn-helix domain containing protein [bacterium]|nr:helix-turn-helix domain containing protein [bacterium]